MAKSATITPEKVDTSVFGEGDFGVVDTQESNSLPYAQLHNPPMGKELDDIEEEGIPWGIYIQAVEAEKAGFTPDSNWKELTLKFRDSDNKAEHKSGYITTTPRFTILATSEQEVEVQTSETANDWKYAGVAWKDGIQTELGLKCRSSKLHRTVKRILVLFLNGENEPLHTTPISLKLRGVLDTTLSRELNGDFTKQVKDGLYAQVGKALEAWGKANGKKVSATITTKDRCLVVCALQMGLQKKAGQSASMCPIGMEYPVVTESNFGKTQTLNRDYNGVPRTMTIKGVRLSDVLLSGTHTTYPIVKDMVAAYPDFSKPRNGNSEKSEPFKGTGLFNFDSATFRDDGTASLTFVSQAGTNKIELTASQTETLSANGEATFNVKGTLKGNTIYPDFLAVKVTSSDPSSEPNLDEIPF